MKVLCGNYGKLFSVEMMGRAKGEEWKYRRSARCEAAARRVALSRRVLFRKLTFLTFVMLLTFFTFKVARCRKMLQGKAMRKITIGYYRYY